MFLRSLVDFDGLTADEILARLFAWWFGPGFLTLLVSFFVPTLRSPLDASSVAAYAGIVLTGLVVLRDARRAGVAKPWMWAVATAVVPLIGWWAYGHVRAPDASIAIAEYRGRPSAPARYLNPFWQTTSELLTRLSPEECAARLDAVRVHWLSPRQWFSSQQERPVQGSVSPSRFALRWRHALTRPGLLTEASGRFEPRGGATVVRLRLGQSVGDRVWVVLWLAIAAIVGIPPVITDQTGAPPGFHQMWLIGWVGIFVLVYAMIRTISRDDDVRLRRLIIETLEAEEALGSVEAMRPA
ncbi:MAG TPA: hypothetical protein VGR85_02865 [Candidatus Limnocylindria bacterium]|nr:hypothetical protein [Candidatus Limnocylindria bacterium]